MDSPAELLIKLHRRIAEHGIDAPSQSVDVSWQAVAFSANGQQLLVNMQQVSEVVEVSSITLIPGVQPWVAGISNVRGVVLPLIDLGLYLEGNASQAGNRSHVIAIERGEVRFGLIVDQVIGMRQVDSEKTEETSATSSTASYLTGKVEIGGDYWHIFDTDRLLISQKIHQIAAA